VLLEQAGRAQSALSKLTFKLSCVPLLPITADHFLPLPAPHSLHPLLTHCIHSLCTLPNTQPQSLTCTRRSRVHPLLPAADHSLPMHPASHCMPCLTTSPMHLPVLCVADSSTTPWLSHSHSPVLDALVCQHAALEDALHQSGHVRIWLQGLNT
jgi:hypothetical protein